MRVDTLGFIVFMIIWAPFSFEIKDIEVEVLVLRKKMVNKSYLDIFYRVSKGTIISILTLLDFIRKEMTEFGFVLVFMIKPFNTVMSSSALVLFRAFFSLRKFAQFWSVIVIIPSLILY